MVKCLVDNGVQNVTFKGSLVELMAQVDYINYRLIKLYTEKEPALYTLLMERYNHFDEIYKILDSEMGDDKVETP